MLFLLHNDAPDQQWTQGMERRLARLRNRWDVSSVITSHALARFTQLQTQKQPDQTL